jgi:hypothetical protein
MCACALARVFVELDKGGPDGIRFVRLEGDKPWLLRREDPRSATGTVDLDPEGMDRHTAAARLWVVFETLTVLTSLSRARLWTLVARRASSPTARAYDCSRAVATLE